MRGHNIEYDFFEMSNFGPQFGCRPSGGPGSFGPGFGRHGPPRHDCTPGYRGPHRHSDDSGDELGHHNHRGHGHRHGGPHEERQQHEPHCGNAGGCRGGPHGPPPPFCEGPRGPDHHEGRRGPPCRECRPPKPFGRGPGPHGDHPRGPPPCHGCPSSFGPQGFGPWHKPRFFGPWCQPAPYGPPGRCCRGDNSDSEDERPGRHGRGRSPCRRGGPCRKGPGDGCRRNSKERRGMNKNGHGQDNEETVLVQRIVVEAPRCRSV